MSRSDDRTKLMPTPATDSGADDRTRAMPQGGAPEPPAGEAEAKAEPSEAADDATRALPTGEEAAPESSGASSDDRTRMLGTTAPEDATAILGETSTPPDDATAVLGESSTPHADDPTVALAPGAAAAAAASAMDEDVTIVRPQARRQPRLLMKSPAGKVEEQKLEGGEAIIGRASSCTIVVANPEVSRKHARIVTGPAGSVLHVEGARRNTTVNGELVEGELLLKHGDVLELASERLVFAETAETPPFEGQQAAAADAPRSLAAPIIAAVGVAALGLGAYLLGSRTQPPPPPPAAPAPVAPPAIDPAKHVEAAAEAAKAAAAEEVRKVAEREAAAAREKSDAERISLLLYEGDIALLEKRFTTPPNGSAFYAYSEVLKIEPDNEHAKTKIVEILETYLGWAESARASGNRRRAREYADKAAYIRERAPTVGDGAAIDQRIAAIRGGAR